MILPHQIFTTQEIRCIEQEHAAQNNGHCYDLMEKAGRAVFTSLQQVNAHPRMVYIFVGKGNNGGDGYIVAANLLRHRLPFRIFSLGQPHPESEAFTAYTYFTKLGGQVEYSLPDMQQEELEGNTPDIVVDALLGTGLDSAPRAPFDEWIDFINSTRAYVISVDIPSGMNADTGEVYADCVLANRTICMLGLKPGLLTGEAVDYTGEIEVCSLDIDMLSYHGSFDPNEMDGVSRLPIFLTDYADIRSDLPVRTPSSHKGDTGKVLVVGGQYGMGGAISLCGQGAIRSGAGLVKVATDARNVSAINAIRPELMTVDFFDEELFAHALAWADVIAIGPGLGTDAHAEKLLDQVLNADKPVVLDADALNIIASRGLCFLSRAILTPHPGEAARLLGTTVEAVVADRYKAVYELQKRCGGVVLLKGAGTLICDGRNILVVHEGSPAMASGGMGDLLTGITVALRAQGLTQRQAVTAAACIHGRAGEMAGEDGGIAGTVASDLLPYIRSLINRRQSLAPSEPETIATPFMFTEP